MSNLYRFAHAFVLAAIIGVAALGCASHQPVTVRVLTYNIHHGEGLDGEIDLERIADVVRETDADLVALQEVDRGVERTARIDEPAELARLTGMSAVFERNIDYQGGEYGNAVLSRLPIERYENHFLPQSLPNEQRGALEVHVKAGETPLVFFATHLDYHPADGERLASIAMLHELLAAHENVPVIIAGDLNAPPDSAVIASAREFLIDSCDASDDPGVTFPADKPNRRIDYVLHNGHAGIRCIERRVIEETVASDHRPVLAIFEIDPGAVRSENDAR